MVKRGTGMSRFITPKDTEKEKFDTAICGVWKGENYGGIATYYALYRCITSLGLSALMIDPELNRKKEGLVSHSEKFAERHYESITKDFFSYDLEKLNECCDTFIMGCDQVWNYEVSRAFGKSFYLDFADDEKKIISYASSFGHPISFTPSAEAQEVEELFRRFDFLSVRETGAVSVLKNEFGVESTRVLDPVFLAGVKVFDEIAEESSRKEEEKYLVSYILDPTPEIREALQYAAQKLNLKLINMLDGIQPKFQKNKEALNILLSKFKNHEIEKHYLAWVYGIPKEKHKRLESYLFKDNKKSMVYISDTFKKGYQKIITTYTILEKRKDNTSILDVEIETGRTHQIRAHLAHIGYPIIGDGKYGRNEINKAFDKKTQMLCSYKLKFNFKSNSGILEYLRGKEIYLSDISSGMFSYNGIIKFNSVSTVLED